MKTKNIMHSAQEKPEEEVCASARPGVRTASKGQFEKARRKTSAAHAGLFRRLAK